MFDFLVLAIVGVSTALAAFRGGLRELSTIAALAIAGGLAYVLAEPIIAAVGLAGSFFGAIAVVVVLVAVFFLIGHIVLHLALRRAPLNGGSKLADRIGGGAFGFLRGLVLVGLAYLGYSYYLDEAQQPDYIRNAMTRPVAAGMADLFESFAPETAYIENATLPSPEEDVTVQGYNRGDRNGLEEIVTTVTTTDEAESATAGETAPDDGAGEDEIADILSEDED